MDAYVCGNCAYVLFIDDTSDVCLCYRIKNKDKQILATDESCEHWLDSRVMRNYEELRSKIKNWTREVLEGDYINQSIILDELNDKCIDLVRENKNLKSKIEELKYK